MEGLCKSGHNLGRQPTKQHFQSQIDSRTLFIVSGIFKRFKQDIYGILWAGVGLFLSLSLWSYSSLDPSINSFQTTGLVRNVCGIAGSFLADILLQGFGAMAWIFPLICFRAAYFAFRGFERPWDKTRVFLASVLIIVLSSLSSLYFSEIRIYAGEILVGGVLGQIISHGLITIFKPVGVAIILWSVTIVFVVFYTERRITDVGKGALILYELLKRTYYRLLDYIEDKKSKKPVPIMNHLPKPNSDIEAKFYVDESEELEEGEATDFQQSLIDRLSFKRKKKKRLIKRTRVANWEMPKLDLLEDTPERRIKIDDKTIKANIRVLEDKLHQFSVKGKVVSVKPGPAVTMYEFKPNADVKISKITDLADDLSLAMSAESVRIIAPLPGRDVVGIETSNPNRDTVYLRENLEDESFWDEEKQLPLTLGKQADGLPKVVDLRRMPHLLVAGTTGSGKSVFVVGALTGLLFKHSPKSMKLILIDPKQVDLAVFHKVPHLIMPPIKEPKKAVSALKWAIKEMEKRYRSMSRFGARNIEGFNEIVSEFSKKEIEEHLQVNAGFEEEGKPNESYYYEHIPYIVIVVEEFGDLMAVDKSNVEQTVVRLAQMARACGIHLILAMQSPRKDVVTGLIKTNIPGRISFKVASKMDSRIILDESGAERLLARGDMLFLAPGVSKPERHHGPWAPEDEITRITSFWSEQDEADFDPLAMKMLEGTGGGFDLSGGLTDSSEEYDERYDEILEYVSTQKEVSASLLQRKFRLGYPRAARMIEIFEQEGVVGPAQGSKPRQVLVGRL